MANNSPNAPEKNGASSSLLTMIRSADFSDCRTYRYALWRVWDASLPVVVIVGLNPSTADEAVDDRTIGRCIRFAQSWGYGGLCMANLFAFRATQPKDMMAASDPCGPENDAWLVRCAADRTVVAAWGNGGSFRGRDMQVRRLIQHMSYLRLTTQDQPAHPLYLPGNLRPITWN